MTLTASDVSSLTRSLSDWEYAEYGACAFVAIACAGEYIANFTNWRTAGDEERKKRLEKRSTLLLIVSLAVELFCLVQTNSISGQLIGSLSDKAANADTKAQSALEKSGTAETKAGDAGRRADKAEEKSGAALAKAEAAEKSLGKAESEANRAQKAASNAFGIANDAKQVAHDARQEADSFEKEIASAKEAAAKAEAKLADRRLTNEQVRSIAEKLIVFNGQTYTVTAYWDSRESLGIANRIHSALLLARWAYSDEGSKSMMLGGEIGVLVWTHPDAGEITKKAAASLIDALNAEGIEAAPRLQNPKNPKSDMISINVGTKH